MGRLITLEEAKQIRQLAKFDEKSVVLTNGCFDLLHPGHIELLSRAKSLGDLLFVAINSDDSVRRLKGVERPYVTQSDRSILLAALGCVDYVLVFEELTPENTIECLVPDTLVKGGDWSVENIVGREIVINSGGRVLSIESTIPQYSTTSLAQQIFDHTLKSTKIIEYKIEKLECNNDNNVLISIEARLQKSALFKIKTAQLLIKNISQAIHLIVSALRKNNKILLCGNGGSAADSQHLAAEFLGRFKDEKEGLPAIALTTDTSILTALANDYGYETVFSRQVQAIAQKGDILIGLSTSGFSPNINEAIKTARTLGLKTIGLSGNGGGELATLVDCAIIVPSIDTAIIQESHISIGHIICELVDAELSVNKAK